MNRAHLLRLVGMLLLLGGIRCDQHKPTAPVVTQTGAVLVEAQLADEGEGAGLSTAAKIPITQGRVRVSGTGMSPRDTLLNVVGGRLKARLERIPVGIRKVELYLLGAEGDTLWQGENDAVNVLANQVVKATLELHRVNDQDPSVDLEVTPLLDKIGRPFSFKAIAKDVHDADDSLRVRWDFDGDGKYDTDWSIDKEASHPYPAVGNYQVVVQVQDKSGKFNTNTNTPSYVPKKVQVIDLQAQAGLRGADTLVRVAGKTETLVLDGSKSQGFPAVLTDSLIYHWEHVVTYPQGISISVKNTFNIDDVHEARTINFEPRQGPGLYVFTLTVEYGGIFSDPDTLFMLVHSRTPVASVNPPGVGQVGEVIQLQGQGTDPDGDPLQYRWRGDQVALLSDSTSQSPTFTPDREGVYTFQLVVIDTDSQESAPQKVEVQVKLKNQPPVADAGLDLEGATGVEVVLDGSGSTDADPGDQAKLIFGWKSLDGPVLSNAADSHPRFTASAPGIYKFELVVSDGSVDSQPDTVAVRVTQQNRPPLADAGPDRETKLGVGVELDGSNSSDADGDAPRFQWVSLDGGVLRQETDPQAVFSADVPRTYRIVLVVNDGQVDSQPDTVLVRVRTNPRLVFASDMGGDWEIYSAELDGSDLVNLTNKSGTDIHPKTSPDGQYIVFASDREGTKDPWTDTTTTDIWKMNADGSNPVPVFFAADWPALSSTGSLVFSSNSGRNEQEGSPDPFIVDILTLDQALTDHRGVNIQSSWSPDGTQIAFSRKLSSFADIYLMNSDGGSLRPLTGTPDWGETEPAWSPEGTRIAFVSDYDQDGLFDNIYLVSVTGGEPVRLTPLESDAFFLSPSWSPDGAMIAYVRLDFASNVADIYIMNADGSNPRKVIEGAQDPAWLPGR